MPAKTVDTERVALLMEIPAGKVSAGTVTGGIVSPVELLPSVPSIVNVMSEVFETKIEPSPIIIFISFPLLTVEYFAPVIFKVSSALRP